MSHAKANGLTRKARDLHRRADSLIGRRPADAQKLRMRARNLETRAEIERIAAVDPDEDTSFFDDSDVPAFATVRAREVTV